MDGYAVTPDALAGAAAAILSTLGDGSLALPPMPVGGAAYGHPGLSAAVADFGNAVGVASGVLVEQAQDASVGLRAGAAAYAQQEQHSAATLAGAAGRPDSPGAR
jgi:hypothetical protein